MRLILIAALLLAGCATVHHSTPQSSTPDDTWTDWVLPAIDSVFFAEALCTESNPCVKITILPEVTDVTPPIQHKHVHKAKRVKAIAEVSVPVMDPVNPSPVIAVPIATLNPPLPDWSVQAIGGAVLVWCLVLVGWMWKKRRPRTMADEMDSMVDELRKGLKKWTP